MLPGALGMSPRTILRDSAHSVARNDGFTSGEYRIGTMWGLGLSRSHSSCSLSAKTRDHDGPTTHSSAYIEGREAARLGDASLALVAQPLGVVAKLIESPPVRHVHESSQVPV